MAKTLQEQMFLDMKRKEIFKQAQSFAFNYAENAGERNVFPADEAINNLEEFVEDMPDGTGDAPDILRQLNTYGEK